MGTIIYASRQCRDFKKNSQPKSATVSAPAVILYNIVLGRDISRTALLYAYIPVAFNLLAEHPLIFAFIITVKNPSNTITQSIPQQQFR